MKKVLIVDDTKNIRNLLTTCLEIEGYEVTTANDGRQALEVFQSHAFDLAFLDIKLPELSGTEVLRKIRGLGINTRVVIMTAFGTVKNAVECTKLGAVVYLQKPFTPEKVRNVLSEIVRDVQGDPENLAFYLNAAKELIACGSLDEAFRRLKASLTIDPNCGEIYFWMARVYEAQGKSKEAERFYIIAKQFKM